MVYRKPNTQTGQFPIVTMPAASALTEPFLRIPSIVRAMLTISGVDMSATAMLWSIEPDTGVTMNRLNRLNTLSTFATTPKKRKRASTILVPPDMMPNLDFAYGFEPIVISNVLQVRYSLCYAWMVTILLPFSASSRVQLSKMLKLSQHFRQRCCP